MTSEPYTTPEACEAAFYEAFRSGDLESMHGIWSAEGPVVCIHPGRPPIAGRAAVLESWTRILGPSGGIRVRFECHDRARAEGLAVHTGLEIIGAEGEPPALVTVTNVYQLTAGGWTMRSHHAAPIHPGADRRGPLH